MNRHQLIKTIQKLIAPHLYESGYREGRIGNSRPLKLYAPKRKNKLITHKINGFVIEEIEAYTNSGVITDTEGGGAYQIGYDAIPIEDLAKIAAKLKRHFNVPSVRDTPTTPTI